MNPIAKQTPPNTQSERSTAANHTNKRAAGRRAELLAERIEEGA